MVAPQKQIVPEPKPYQWTRDEYYKMGEIGFFNGKRIELIEGKIIEMSPIHSPHATAVTLCDEIIRETFGRGWVVRVHNPLSLGGDSDPQSDVAVVAGKTRDFKETHPTTAALLIEVADSSLIYDSESKASLYAKSGIADYWIVNLQDRQVEVYRRPIADENAEFGFIFADKMIFRESDSVKPLAKPKASIKVADLLP
jgi:Uma2 family endonuclease